MPYQPIGQFGYPAPNPEFAQLHRAKGGYIHVQEVILSGGTQGVIRSENFVSLTSGWAVFGDGSAEFNDITVRGDIVSSNWDGTLPVDLSAEDTGATAGFALDSSEGAAQFEGSVFIGGDLELTGTGSVFRSADSGSDRVEIGGGDTFFTFYADFLGTPIVHGFVGWEPTGYGANELTIATETNTDPIVITPDGRLTLNPGGDGGFGVVIETDAAGGLPGYPFLIFDDGQFNEYFRISTTPQVLAQDGSAASPAYSFADDDDIGMYRVSANLLGFSVAGVKAGTVNSAGDWVLGSGGTGKAKIHDAAGSNSFPTYAFDGDVNLGINRQSADVMGLIANGSLQADVRSGGLRLASSKTIEDSAGDEILPGTGTTFTPTLRATSSNPSNYSALGRWIRVGNLVHVFFEFKMNSGFNGGSGLWLVDPAADGLPTPWSTLDGTKDIPVGHWMGEDVSASSNRYAGPVVIQATSQDFLFLRDETAGTAWRVGASDPFTWANTDWITGYFVYVTT